MVAQGKVTVIKMRKKTRKQTSILRVASAEKKGTYRFE